MIYITYVMRITAQNKPENRTMKTYTVKQFDHSGWNVDSEGNFLSFSVLWDCGHKHRTLTGVVKCLHTLDGSTRSINSEIIASDGSDIDEYEIYAIEDSLGYLK